MSEFHVSSYSNNGKGPELGRDGDDWIIRDPAFPDGPCLRFTDAEIQALLAGVKADEFTVGAPDAFSETESAGTPVNLLSDTVDIEDAA